MRIPIKNRGHISPENFSEYLDGRLSPGARQRVERHIEGCSGCSQELRSLEHTIGLLRQTPAVSPRRSFTLREAPSPAPRGWSLQPPAWAYGAAASVAVAMFAVILSLDLGGSLAPDAVRQEPSAQAMEAPPDSKAIIQQAPVAPDEGEPAARAGTPPPEPVAAEALRESFQDAALAAPPPKSAEAKPAQEMAAAPVAEAPAAADAPQAEPSPERIEPEAETSGEAAPAPVQLESPPLAEKPRSTAFLWHILEGVSSGAALLLAGLVLWRMRRHRHRPTA
jgi:hypothetical protein